MMLHPLISRLEELNMKTVKAMERIKKVRGVGRIEWVKRVEEAIGEIR